MVDDRARLRQLVVKLKKSFLGGTLLPGTYKDALDILDIFRWPAGWFGNLQSGLSEVIDLLSDEEVSSFADRIDAILAIKNANNYED